PNTPEVNDVKIKTTSYGAGAGYFTKSFHFEASIEKVLDTEVTQSNTYLYDMPTPSKGQRISAVGEIRLGKVSLGARIRQISGNYSDLEQLISSNMLNVNTKEADSKLETTFNFAYGSDKGFSISGFYSTSKSESEEIVEMVQTEVEYPTETTTNSY